MRMEEFSGKIRENHFPIGLFAQILGALLTTAGINIGFYLLFVDVWNPGPIVAPIFMMIYWGSVSTVITVFIKNKIKTSYEEPLKALAKATGEVAHGDFSVYVPTIHTADQLDYLDVMIMDFNKMVEDLGSIETLKTDFFSNVSHEIKTPLAVIANSAEVMKSAADLSPEQREHVETILSASRRLSSLITNILKLNRLEKQVIQPENTQYDLCAQICDSILQFENRWEEKEIELDVDMEDSVMIEADPSLMELVWNNLISNAIKFTEKGGTIRVNESSNEENVRIQVTDSGCGMSKETMEHIFDKFYQGDTSHATEGNGLGLALAVRILELSGGSIHVTSELGVGTTFTVTIGKVVEK